MIFGIQSWFGFCQIGYNYRPELVIVFGDKHIIIFPKTWANHYTQFVSWVSIVYLEAMGKLRRVVG
jgi:hypothetical protein